MDERAEGWGNCRRHARSALVAVLVSTLLAHSPAKAEIDGTVEDLEEGYMLYQAVDACPLTPSTAAMGILKAEIRRLEGGVNEGKRQKLWAEASADMPKVVALGICGVLDMELQLLEKVKGVENPLPAQPKPVF